MPRRPPATADCDGAAHREGGPRRHHHHCALKAGRLTSVKGGIGQPAQAVSTGHRCLQRFGRARHTADGLKGLQLPSVDTAPLSSDAAGLQTAPSTCQTAPSTCKSHLAHRAWAPSGSQCVGVVGQGESQAVQVVSCMLRSRRARLLFAGKQHGKRRLQGAWVGAMGQHSRGSQIAE